MVKKVIKLQTTVGGNTLKTPILLQFNHSGLGHTIVILQMQEIMNRYGMSQIQVIIVDTYMHMADIL